MNSKRIEKLQREDRENYIREGLNGKTLNELRHMVSEYGIKNILSMSRDDLVEEVVSALCQWANSEHDLPIYRDDTLLPVPEYFPIGSTCAIPGCSKTLFQSGICSKHWYQYVNTPTGTYRPAWLEMLISQHRSYERKAYNSEIPFSWMEDGGEHL